MQANAIHHHFRRVAMNNFSKVIFLGLAVGLFNPAVADDTLQGGDDKADALLPDRKGAMGLSSRF
jgi:hypothetical protein